MNEAADDAPDAANDVPRDEPTLVDQLTPQSAGRWLVTTRGADHLFDLEAGTYRRTPRHGSARFPYDGVAVLITRVPLWPKVGSNFLIWYDDRDFPDTLERWHLSSPVASIRYVGDGQRSEG
jgi:hypothetical protein